MDRAAEAIRMFSFGVCIEMCVPFDVRLQPSASRAQDCRETEQQNSKRLDIDTTGESLAFFRAFLLEYLLVSSAIWIADSILFFFGRGIFLFTSIPRRRQRQCTRRLLSFTESGKIIQAHYVHSHRSASFRGFPLPEIKLDHGENCFPYYLQPKQCKSKCRRVCTLRTDTSTSAH